MGPLFVSLDFLLRMKGTFENNQKEKKVLFDQPVKARYIRFTALSEQRGQDFASGAELVILAD